MSLRLPSLPPPSAECRAKAQKYANAFWMWGLIAAGCFYFWGWKAGAVPGLLALWAVFESVKATRLGVRAEQIEGIYSRAEARAAAKSGQQ